MAAMFDVLTKKDNEKSVVKYRKRSNDGCRYIPQVYQKYRGTQPVVALFPLTSAVLQCTGIPLNNNFFVVSSSLQTALFSSKALVW